MNKKRLRLEGDFSFLALILLLLICLIFTGNSAKEAWGVNIALFCAASIAFLVTYFVSVTAGLIADLLILFVYINYILYDVFRTGTTIDMQVYFWVIWIPVTTLAFHLFSANMKGLQAENEEMRQQVEEMTLLDKDTGLENLHSFENNCVVYMRIAERYHMSLVLVVWELRYENEVKKLLGKRKFAEEISMISNVARETLREEDSLFLLQESPHLWGTIMFTSEGGEKVAIERLKANLETHWKERGGEHVQMDLRFGMALHENGKRIPLEFLEKARKRLSYDV